VFEFRVPVSVIIFFATARTVALRSVKLPVQWTREDVSVSKMQYKLEDGHISSPYDKFNYSCTITPLPLHFHDAVFNQSTHLSLYVPQNNNNNNNIFLGSNCNCNKIIILILSK
jgi:hypothetical protein